MAPKPLLGQPVLFRSHYGVDCPAVITATWDSIDARPERKDDLVESRLLRQLSSPDHVHLTVFTPITTVHAGSEQVVDVPHAPVPALRTWRRHAEWPPPDEE